MKAVTRKPLGWSGEAGGPQFGALPTRAPLSPRRTALSVASCGNHGAAPNSGTRVPGNQTSGETDVGVQVVPVRLASECSLRLLQGGSRARRLVSSTTRGTRRVRTGALAAPAVIARFHDSSSCADQCPPAGRAHARACRARLSSTVAAFSGGAREKSRTISVIPKQLHFATCR